MRSALAAGADGYLVLDLADAETVRVTIAAVLAGRRAIPPELRGSCSQLHRNVVITARSLEVLRSLADGLHDDEIAERLGISTSSVRKHICGAQERLRARTRTQAVAMAARRGFL
jgi:DNA-binding NarL/FixJ family response regulator